MDLIDRAFDAWDRAVLAAPLASALGDFHGPWRGGSPGFTHRLRASCKRDLRARISEQCGYDEITTADELHDAMRVSDESLSLILHHVLALATGGTTNDTTTWRSAIHERPTVERSEW